MTKQFFLVFIFILFGKCSFSQGFYYPCQDSSKIVDIFYHCYDDYDPVCACDGITYRNECSAENQHAINSGNYIMGPCTNLDYDISPNQIIDFINVKVKKKNAGYITINIFDTFGHMSLTQTLPYSDVSAKYLSYEISFSGYEEGLYIFELISDEERQVKKFFKVNLE